MLFDCCCRECRYQDVVEEKWETCPACDADDVEIHRYVESDDEYYAPMRLNEIPQIEEIE
jgi:hypothetical protein